MSTETCINRAERDRFYILVGETIRDLREERTLTQRELALKSGLTQTMISNAEHGQTCSLLVLAKIAEGLDCLIDELVPLEATR